MRTIKRTMTAPRTTKLFKRRRLTTTKTQIDNMPHSPVGLDGMPILALHTIVSHLDIAHVISLTQVNRQLRYSPTNDSGYWVHFLRTRLNIKLTGKRRNNAFFELMRRLPTLRCAHCHEMQLRRLPFIHPFWNRPLCDACRIDDKYRFVTAYTAKKNYFLDENDLLSLRTFNQHYENASHVRFFSRVEVQRRSELKLQLLQTTRIDQLKKRDLRSQQAKDRWRKRRHNNIIQLLTANGFPHASRHHCTAVDGFVRNRLNGRRGRGRRLGWTAEDVVRIFCARHMT